MIGIAEYYRARAARHEIQHGRDCNGGDHWLLTLPQPDCRRKTPGILPQRPITYRGQNIVSLSILGSAIVIAHPSPIHPEYTHLFPVMVGVALLSDLLSLLSAARTCRRHLTLNSYAGLSAALLGSC